LLNESGLKTYERGGKISGVMQGKYKFRFKRIGFVEIKLDELDKAQHRKHELHQSRSRGSNLKIQKER